MQYFSSGFITFFKELSANNHKDWFDENRKRYEKEVKEPFKTFIGDLIPEVQKHDPEIQIQPKDAIFRINRDIRFSKDKTPYKTNVSAIISPYGRKDKSNPGLYVELGPEDMRVYGGLYMLSTQQVYNVRNAIANNLELFSNLVGNEVFVKHYGEIHGQQAKRLPKEFVEASEKQPLIFNKNWYYFNKFPAKTVENNNLMKTVMDYYVAGKPLMEFFKEAL